MKSRFFYGVFVGFILGCLFFFGVMNVNAQTHEAVEYNANYAGNYYYDANQAEDYQDLYAYDYRSSVYTDYNRDNNRIAEYDNIG